MALPSMKKIYIQYTSDLKINIELPAGKLKELTCRWLLKEAIERLKELGSKETRSEDVVALQTADGKFAVDYWLTQPHKSLFVLKDGIVLKPFYKQDVGSRTEPGKIGLDNFIIEAKIGFGAFSNVYLVRRKETGALYALKQVQKGDLNRRKKKIVMRERQALLDITSTNVVTLHCSFQTENHFYFVMDFVPCGDLHSLLSLRKLKEDEVRFYIAESILGLNAIHSQDYIYRDLKPENLLLNLDGHIMITDFGLSKRVLSLGELNYSHCGTPQIMAPEIMRRTGYNCLVDYYNVGTLAYELATGKIPVLNEKDRAFLEEKNPEFEKLSTDLQDFIKRLLEPNPAKRLGANAGLRDISAHPWMAPISLSQLNRRKIRPPLLFDPNSIKYKTLEVAMSEPIDKMGGKERNFGENNLEYFSFYGFGDESPFSSALDLVEKSMSEKTGRISVASNASTSSGNSALICNKSKSLEPSKLGKEAKMISVEEDFESFEIEDGIESAADRFESYKMPLAKSMRVLQTPQKMKLFP